MKMTLMYYNDLSKQDLKASKAFKIVASSL